LILRGREGIPIRKGKKGSKEKGGNSAVIAFPSDGKMRREKGSFLRMRKGGEGRGPSSNFGGGGRIGEGVQGGRSKKKKFANIPALFEAREGEKGGL